MGWIRRAIQKLSRLSDRLRHPQPTRFDVHFRAFGSPVRVHPTFWLINIGFALIIAAADFLRGDSWWPLAFVLCFAGTTVSVLAHELGHTLAGRRFGLHGEIVLTSVGGFARWTHADYAVNLGYCPSRRQRVLTMLAGPAVNLVIVVMALTAWALMGSAAAIYHEVVSNPYAIPPSLMGCSLLEFLVLVLAGVNLAASVGQLVPIPPHDGWWIALEVRGWLRTRGRPSWNPDAPEWWNRARRQ